MTVRIKIRTCLLHTFNLNIFSWFPLAVTVSLDMTEYSFTEEYAYMDVCVNITDGLAERNVIVELASMNGTAEGNKQYKVKIFSWTY